MTEPLVNGERGEWILPVGDVKFVFEPSFERIAQLETKLGRPIIQLASEISTQRRVSFSDIADIIMIMSKDNSRTRDQIGALLLQKGFANTMDLLAGFLDRVLNGVSNPEKPGN